MGFLKSKISYLLLMIFVAGCAKSLIKISAKLDETPYSMFGGVPSRNFYTPVDVTDSLRVVWENSTYGSFSNSSVTIYDDFVFVSDLAGRIFVFDIYDGDRVGVLKYKGAIYTAPLVFKTTLIFAVAKEGGNFTELVYYDYFSGKVITEKEIYSRVMTEMLHDGEFVYFVTESGRVNKYSLSGKLIWETETEATTRCSPALHNGVLIFGNDYGEIIAVNTVNGEIDYRKKYEGIFNGSVVIDDSLFFVSNNNGFVYSFSFNDCKLNWKYDTGNRITMSPAIDETHLFIGNLNGDLFSLNKHNGELIWKKHFKGVLNATPLVTNNKIVLPDLSGKYYLIDKRTGKVTREIILEGRAKLTPVYFKNKLFIGYDNGELRAYEFY